MRGHLSQVSGDLSSTVTQSGPSFHGFHGSFHIFDPRRGVHDPWLASMTDARATEPPGRYRHLPCSSCLQARSSVGRFRQHELGEAFCLTFSSWKLYLCGFFHPLPHLCAPHPSALALTTPSGAEALSLLWVGPSCLFSLRACCRRRLRTATCH